MFRVSTIAIALMLILAGMKITIASHYCQGSLAKTIISLDGRSASCGMEHDEPSTDETIISSLCCDDELNVYSVSNDYAPSDIRFIQLFHAFDYFLPEILLPSSYLSSLPKQTINSPPGYFLISEVRSAEICVFRI